MNERSPGKVCAVIRGSSGAEVERTLSNLAARPEVVELRLDYLRTGEATPAIVSGWVRKADCPVILTLRRRSTGGQFAGSEAKQVEILSSLLETGASFIDLEIETITSYLRGDLAPLRKGNVRWIASYHNFRETPRELDTIFGQLLGTKADVLKVATLAQSFADNFALLHLTRRARQEQLPIVCVAMGELGVLTRILGPGYGSLWTYGSLGEGQESAPGQFTVDELRDLYAVDRIDEHTDVYGVIGYPIGHSLSPHVHNAAFRELGIRACYLPFSVQNLADFGPHVNKFSGFSVTIPHKLRILDFADSVDETVELTGAANTLAKRNGRMVAYNTDIEGVRIALRKPLGQRIRQATLLGSGGAARAAACVLKQAGCSVTVLARHRQKAKIFSEEFGFAHDVLSEAERYGGDLLVNATSVGMAPQINESPVSQKALGYRYVFDMVYNPPETRLMMEARGNSTVIGGVEMFVAQGARQFELWTGRTAPVELMRRIVLEKLSS
jgi:3-dehydroquinate dehydratase / shikimate dehydrogenase